MLLLLIVAFSICLPGSLQDGQDCTVQISFLMHTDPIYFTQEYEFLYPNHGRITYIKHEDQVIIACPNGTLSYRPDDQLLNNNASVVATCNDTIMEVDGQEVAFIRFQCSLGRAENSRPSSTTSCPGGFTGLDVGFEVIDNFVPQYSVCFDESNQIPLYAQYNILDVIKYASWILLDANIIVDEQYTTVDNYLESFLTYNQMATINKQLGLDPHSEKYINFDYYFKLQPLVPGDYFYQFKQQDAAFRSVNAIPEWNLSSNWDGMRETLRDLVTELGLNLVGYTGIYGQLTLPHEDTGEEIPLFVYVEDDVTALPIPAVLWTLIYEPIRQKAVAFVSVNNGYRLNEEEEVLCQDVTDELGWLTWFDRENITYGYSYTCTYDDLKSKITYLPDLVVNGLLTIPFSN